MPKNLRGLAASLVCGTAVALAAAATPATASPVAHSRATGPAHPAFGVIIRPGTELPKNYHYQSQRADLVFQADGNLVDYDETGTARWATGTDHRGYRAIFQADGNLVVYDVNDHPLWASNTFGHTGAILAVQDDGNVVIYDGQYAIWATGTNH